jgi:hypothetical protein
VRELVRSRGEKPIVPDNLEQLIGRETQVPTLPSQEGSNVTEERILERPGAYWEGARHWAAFAIYGA